MSGVEVEKNSTSEKTPTTLQSPAVDNGSSRKTFHYSKLPEETLSLSIRKLDGSSFNVEVLKSATVADLKLGVQNVFDHLPNGPDKISWVHVWGHFCLSYGDQKLIQDTDLIVNYGIKDSDQLHFIRHVSSCTNSKKIPKNKETVPQDHSYQLLVGEVEDDYEVLKEGSCVHLWSSCSNLSSFKGTATFKNRGCRSSVCVIL
ncbi:hypothetical protein HRI_002597800 [Hibiscus trionum]|uniref:Ubiquitin-like domain-containing protein n=1 Tax=Hibiscus trionum TaxID=183268 RepID=A0A9W7M8E2_HIBTR|nr:hypothetical protein HRI_002597800 [Hibiscus trionum]